MKVLFSKYRKKTEGIKLIILMSNNDVELGARGSIGRNVNFLLDYKRKGQDRDNQPRSSIFMVPKLYRDISPISFTPRLVSIGPLHGKDTNLQKFEVQKSTYLHNLLALCDPKQKQTLEDCVRKVSMKIKEIKACYEESATYYGDEELARIMVIDGCFILYFTYVISGKAGRFLGNRSTIPLIVNDMLLIENQIPFFVLKDIFEATFPQFERNPSLTDYLKILLKGYNLFRDNKVTDNINLSAPHDHILGLLHNCLVPMHLPGSQSFLQKGGPAFEQERHSAMELDRAGVNFRANKDVNWPMAMKLELPRFSCFPSFWCKPTLLMPKLYVHDSTELVLRNLILYEQSSLVPEYVTSYMWAMDMLVDTPEDVAKLVKSGVLVNHCGSNENAANIINNICQDVSLDGFYYHQEWEDLDTYYKSCWPNAAAALKRKYFSSPWTIIALFAAIVLFVLTLVQTIYTVKPQGP
ncbi:unnamed protein product [Lactuca virosa]|uniref:Uncharacterized protein n=1 Tax=Lactuca virosa TaxID=75947 RepID=A0AAU9N7P8_9ASTR|nr:unnamed protein product [Lactuca virosa]